jgi:hypothetical protein
MSAGKGEKEMGSKFALSASILSFVLGVTAFTASAPAVPAFDFEDRMARVTTSGAASRMVGWEFRTNAPIIVSHLGYFDAGNTNPTAPPDGLFRSYQMGVWRVDGTLLTSGTVQSGTGSPELQSYRYADVPDVTLEPGQNYVVAGFLPQGEYSQQTYDPYPDFGSDWIFPAPGGGFEVRQPVVDYEPQITQVQNRFALFNTSFVFPNQTFAGDNLVGAANFQFTVVPEPATVGLFVVALGVAVARRR